MDMVARLVSSVAWAACLMLGLGTVSGAAQVESVVLGPATGEADGGDPGGHARDLAEVASMMSPSLSLPQGSTIEPIVVTGEDFRAEPPPVADAVSVPEGFDEGQSIELVDRRTLRSRTFQNPDGSLTSHFGMVPLHFENEAGQLVPVDSRLVVGPDGLLTNAANAWDVRFDRLDRGVEIRVEGASVAAWKTQAPVELALTASTIGGIGLGVGMVQIAHLFGPSRPAAPSPVATNTGGARFVAGSDGVVTDLVGGSPNAVVLGKYPAYVNEGAATGARTFSMSDDAWNAMTPAQQWTRNQQFLDQAISRGSEIRLATPPTASNLTGWYAREIEYLSKQGYTISSDGARMIPPGG
jgi:hypothetical protein